MSLLQQAINLAEEAHKDQWRRPTTVKTDAWDCYKSKSSILHENGNKISWCNGDTFLVHKPYITHPLQVMAMMETEEEKTIAILHDVIEDNADFYLDLDMNNFNYYLSQKHKREKSLKITRNIYFALKLLTHKKEVPYVEYISNLATNNIISGFHDQHINKLAIKVKIADITCNLCDNPSINQLDKYPKAMKVLLQHV